MIITLFGDFCFLLFSLVWPVSFCEPYIFFKSPNKLEIVGNTCPRVLTSLKGVRKELTHLTALLPTPWWQCNEESKEGVQKARILVSRFIEYFWSFLLFKTINKTKFWNFYFCIINYNIKIISLINLNWSLECWSLQEELLRC